MAVKEINTRQPAALLERLQRIHADPQTSAVKLDKAELGELLKLSMRGRSMHLSQKETEKLIELRRKGKPQKEIAKQLGVSKNTVIFNLKKAGLPTQQQGLQEEKQKAIINMKEQSIPNKEIVKKLKVSATTVSKYLKLAGLMTRLPLQEEEKEAINKLRQESMTQQEIAGKINRAVSVVNRQLLKQGMRTRLEPRKRVDKEKHQMIMLMNEQKSKQAEIAEKLNLSVSAVSHHLIKEGIKTIPKRKKPHQLTEEDGEAILAMRAYGSKQKAIAAKLDIAASTVNKFLTSHGIRQYRPKN